uniref:Uncharacterized protein n=1 Tax=Cacopsylla melanoneura TaxID=428564 RepID=A0A8D8RI13_9HEMI
MNSVSRFPTERLRSSFTSKILSVTLLTKKMFMNREREIESCNVCFKRGEIQAQNDAIFEQTHKFLSPRFSMPYSLRASLRNPCYPHVHDVVQLLFCHVNHDINSMEAQKN